MSFRKLTVEFQVTLPCAAFGTGVPLQMCGASQWCAGNVLPMAFAALFQPPSARAPWTAILIGSGVPADLSWVEKISNLRIPETCGKHRPEALHFCHSTRYGAQSKAWRMIGKLEENLLHPPTILLLKRKLHRTCGFQVSTLHLSGGQDFAHPEDPGSHPENIVDAWWCWKTFGENRCFFSVSFMFSSAPKLHSGLPPPCPWCLRFPLHECGPSAFGGGS